MFAERLFDRIKKMENPTVLGLDPRIEYVPDSIRGKFHNDSAAIKDFNRKLLYTLHDVVPAVKFQSAYYELLGPEGAFVLKESIDFARSLGMIVMLDGKRNDIGSTADAYAEAYLGKSGYDADALTVNAYLGTDGIEPFVKLCKRYGKGIFILVKTSNPSSGEFQDLVLESGKRIYEHMAGMVSGWGREYIDGSGYSCIGAVIGATYPGELKALRTSMPSTPFLIPGYGAQGGKAADVRHGFDERMTGAVINSSRGLMCAWKKGGYTHEEFCDAARHEAFVMKKTLGKFKEKRIGSTAFA